MSNVLDVIEVEDKDIAENGEIVPLDPEHYSEGDEAIQRRWEIRTLGSADWAMGRLSELEAEVSAVDAQEKAAQDAIRKRAADLKEKAQRGISFFRGMLAEYAAKNRTALLGGGKKKSRDFVHGRIGFRKKGGRLTVTNKDELCAWLASQPIESGLYRFKIEPEMSEIQALCKRTGEVPPGMDYAPEYEDVYVEAIAPEGALMKGDGNV